MLTENRLSLQSPLSSHMTKKVYKYKPILNYSLIILKFYNNVMIN